MRIIWFILGWLFFAVGALGVFLPLLPGVVFLLLAAFCFARSSDRAKEWLMSHSLFGPPIRDWYERGAIRPKSKLIATLTIIFAVIVAIIFGIPPYALVLQVTVLTGVVIFILTRPDS